MKKLLVLAVIIFSAYKGWQHFNKPGPADLLYEKPYVAVYGRDSCGYTQRMLKDLKNKGIKPEYLIVDDKQVADTLHARMRQSGISTQRYNLPVVDVNGYIIVRPNIDEVLNKYRVNAG